MAVVKVNYTSGAGAVSSNTLTVSNSVWATKATAGNMLILAVTVSATTTATLSVTTPSGWTKATGGTNAVGTSNVRTATYLFYKVAAGSDTIASVTTANATSGRYMIYEYSGLATTTPLDNTQATQSTVATLTNAQALYSHQAITTTFANDWMFVVDGATMSATPTGAGTISGVTPYTLTTPVNIQDFSYTTAVVMTSYTNQFNQQYTNGIESHGVSYNGTSLTVRSGVSAYAVFKSKVTNSAPTATYSITRNFMVATLDGSGSSDPNGSGTIQYWNWNWGDGTSNQTTTPTTTHTYTTAGNYTIQLYVTDTSGANSPMVQLTNQYFRRAPASNFTVYPNNPTYLSARVDASASTSPDSTITGYAVDWGDGTTTANQSSPNITHVYASRGTYTVKVTVTDATGATSWRTLTVKVFPSVAFAVKSSYVFMRASVTATYGVNDYPLSSVVINWGDGTVDTFTTDMESRKSHTYTTPGSYSYSVTMFNTNGEGSTYTYGPFTFTPATAQGKYLDASGTSHDGYMWRYYDPSQVPAGLSVDTDLKLAFHMPEQAHYVAQFRGTNGAALPSEWSVQQGDTNYFAGIQNNKMVLSTAPYAWAGNPAAYLSGVLPIDDFEARFDLSLNDLNEQYPYFAFRMQNELIWPGGPGVGLPQTGYAMILGPGGNIIEIQQGSTAGTTLDQFAYTFTSPTMKFRVQAQQQRLRIKVWGSNVVEPSAWNYDKNILVDQTSGRFMFRAANGPSPSGESVVVDNFKVLNLRDPVALRNTTRAPVGNRVNFRQTLAENFDTDADPGTDIGQFMSTYSNSFQPYNDSSPYFPRVAMSSHNGVLDVNLNGTQGAAGSFGGPNDYYSYVGGRFSMRAKAIGGETNGAIVMLWPTSEVWAQGEIDFPASNYENTPLVQHHDMVSGGETNSQKINTSVSWRDWHVYTIEWIPGTSVKYYLDDVLIGTITNNVPTTAHRYMFQTGNYGNKGHLYIDWVAMWAYDTSITQAS